jgi:hypothetical protein
MPVIISGATSGATTIQATDAVTATITLPSATTTLVGATTPSFTTTIGVGGATPSASGAGITFPATQSASTNANTLDDYEEGTWTATLTATTPPTSVPSVTGTYTKIGRQVTVQAYFTNVNMGGYAGQVRVAGLPFTVGTTTMSAAPSSTGNAFTSALFAIASLNSMDLVNSETLNPAPTTGGAGNYLVVNVTYFV